MEAEQIVNELAPRVDVVEDDLKTLAKRQSETRDKVAELRDEVIEVKEDVVEMKGLMVQHITDAAAGQASCKKAIEELTDKMKVRVKWGSIAKGLGTFVGGALVAFVPAQSEKVAALVSKLLDLIP